MIKFGISMILCFLPLLLEKMIHLFWCDIGRLLDTRIFLKATRNWSKDFACVIHTSQPLMLAKPTHWRGSVIQATMWQWGHTSPRRLWNQNQLMNFWNWTQRASMLLVLRTLSSWQWRVLLLDCRTLVNSSMVQSLLLFSSALFL